jgi:Leucine-rich repeat (LRR) protein
MKNRTTGITALLIFLLTASVAFPQKKEFKDPLQQKPAAASPQKKSSGNKPAPKKDAKTTTKEPATPVITEFTPEQIEGFKVQCNGIVKFFEGTLNFLADKRNPVKEKEIVINESYLKFVWDSKVQVEDDLDEKRLVPLYKDMPAYLTDVDFFFKGAVFAYTVQDVSVMKNDIGQTYFKITANRNLKGITVNNDSVNSNKVRYFEVNYDDSKQELKIVSIYTTKMNERDDMRNWWNGLPAAWKQVFGSSLEIDANSKLAQVSQFNDSTAIVNGTPVKPDAARFYALLLQVISSKEIEITGNAELTDLDPLSKLSSLVRVNLSGSAVSDLMPLRNLNQLEELDISGTQVKVLEPLRYASHLRILKLKNTPVTTLEVLTGLTAIEVLDFSTTAIDSLQPLAGLTAMKDLRFSETRVSDLTPLAGLTNIEVLYFTNTPVSNLSPLKGMSNLKLVFFDNTGVQSLDVFDQLPGVKKIYCNNTKVDPGKALRFRLDHPQVDLVFETEALATWWSTMPEEWKKVFHLYRKLDEVPGTEQLHQLITLDSLNITGRQLITSLEPLSKLTQLRILDCASTGITSFEPLRNLPELTALNATNTKVTGIEPLSVMKEMTVLSIDNTQVADLSPLKGCKKLKFIYADNTGITLAKANAFMDDNPSCLVISQTYENTNWWNGLSQAWKDGLLRYFSLSGTPDKIQLQQIVGSDKLVISEDPGIISLQPVVMFSRLKELEVSDTRISNLDPLSRMTRLQVIRFPKNPVTLLGPISTLGNLRELDCSNTQVEDLAPLQNLMFLEALKFSGTPVKNLKAIQNMRTLKVLEFYNTKVSSLDVLEPMTGLKSLKIFNTKVSEKKVAKFKQGHPGCEVVFY